MPETNLKELSKAILFDTDKLERFKNIVREHKRIIIIGNGGSNAIAGHIAQDYTKFLHKQALSFSDSPRLTCYGNDIGVENAYAQFIKDFAEDDTLVILISSSGNSPNIIKAADFCVHRGLRLVTLSGFDRYNKLTSFDSHAALSVHVGSNSYGVVEIAHLAFLHSLV